MVIKKIILKTLFIFLLFGIFVNAEDSVAQDSNSGSSATIERSESIENKNRFISFALGFGYGFDYISGTNLKASIITSMSLNFNKWSLEIPLLLSYIVPGDRYFVNYYNNNGDGYGFDIAALFSYGLFNKWGLSAVVKAGAGYGFSYSYASKDRLAAASTTRINDFSRVAYNSIFLRANIELGYKSNFLGIMLNYYFPNIESFNNLGVASNNTLFNSFGLSGYYIYRF